MARPKLVKKETIKRIRDIYSKGQLTQKELSKKFDLSQSTICKIINEKIHKRTDIRFSGSAEVKIGYKYGN